MLQVLLRSETDKPPQATVWAILRSCINASMMYDMSVVEVEVLALA